MLTRKVKNRLLSIFVFIFFLIFLVYFILSSLNKNILYFKTPSEVFSSVDIMEKNKNQSFWILCKVEGFSPGTLFYLLYKFKMDFIIVSAKSQSSSSSISMPLILSRINSLKYLI